MQWTSSVLTARACGAVLDIYRSLRSGTRSPKGENSGLGAFWLGDFSASKQSPRCAVGLVNANGWLAEHKVIIIWIKNK
jgi:hypothetical protein